jgi:hypothetical protein
VYLVNFYTKQIYLFNSNDTFTLVKTWTENIGGITTDDTAGCSVVALNGRVYLLGKMGTAITTNNSGMSAGPVEFNIADNWSSRACTAYPDYAAQSAYTYNGYYGAQWVAIGDCIYGYGGKIQGLNAVVGDGTGDAAGFDLLRIVRFDPNSGTYGTWSDEGIIPAALYYGSTGVYLNKGYLIAGYSGAVAQQATLELTYRPSSVSNVTYTYNPATTTVNLFWSWPGANPSFFNIKRRAINVAEWTDLGETANGAARTFVDAGVDIFVTGYYLITACEVVP